MRKLKFIFFVLIIPIIILIIANAAIAYDNRFWFQIKTGTDAYKYSIYEGTDPIKYDKTIKLYQIPQDELKKMSTDGLIESCFNYPLFAADMIFSNNSTYEGFQKTRKQFNGLQEIFKRNDSASKLLELYISIDFEKVISTDPYYIFRIKYFEYILSQKEILENLTLQERKGLNKKCIENIKLKMKDYSDSFFIDSTLLILVRIANMDDAEFIEYKKSTQTIDGFIENGLLEYAAENELMQFIIK